ncbi:Copper amine oxidase 1 [Sphaceloma murrayae]|uniref:Amine oxidase n=1 Tax=Sphaceloma murrayae TaxID=2082308 RepID=A0A2K1R063_9PEZI|nr:Copper amine oxidase 1 [Sphaceloma murrayae]
MAPTLEDTPLPSPPATKAGAPHIFAPLSADEIKYAASLLSKSWPAGTQIYFRAITLEEPVKAEAIKYLEAEQTGTALPSIDRKAFVGYHIVNTDKLHDAIVNLSTQIVEKNVRLGKNVHASLSNEEILAIEKIALQDAGVQAAIAKLKLPEGTVIVCDPWPYGSDGVGDDERRWQCFMYMRDPSNSGEEDSNHYSLPLSISPVIDGVTRKVIRIDYMPTGTDANPKEPEAWKPKPANEYINSYHELRKDLKPLQVVQPEGASFTVSTQGTLSTLSWQKWTFKIGFNQREGMVLYDVRYENRPLFYRVSLSDMNIPYADPRHPFHKKSAFDLGDAGAGIMANDLQLGCDCLGSIHYLSSVLSDEVGGTLDMPNCVCIHEQDNGLLWKHTNYRTGRAAVARNRELIIQSIITVANYEYILAFQFNQAGELAYEVRATGILSTQPIDEDISVPWGTVVHPGVLAAHHQHIFSLRIDPMIEGHANRIVYDEALPLPRSDLNPHGTGYITQETVIDTSGGYDLDIDKNRVFKIQNSAVKNPVNGKAVGYKIVAPPFQKILSDKESFNYKRAEFSDRNLYVVKYRDDELFAGGKYTNQSRGGTGVRSWAERRDGVKDEDLVVFVQFGINHVSASVYIFMPTFFPSPLHGHPYGHSSGGLTLRAQIPRIEDFPVMPSEIIKVMLKPVNFFDKNPGIDVPPSTQAFNKSTLLSEQHHQPSAVGTVNGNGGICCSDGTNGNGTNGGSGTH